eukprot:359586-Chlamydomonas_euryale.AAC.15
MHPTGNIPAHDSSEPMLRPADSFLGTVAAAAHHTGVMIRYRKEGMPRLDRDVFGRLDKMYRTSRIKAADLDQRVFDALATLPPSIALRTIDRFQSRCGEDVRNVSAFFMSMLRTVRACAPAASGWASKAANQHADAVQLAGVCMVWVGWSAPRRGFAV